MLSRTNLKNLAQAAGYYERDDYYTHGRSPSQWWGKAAKDLGLKRSVDRDTFRSLLEGRLPDGTELPAGHAGQRRLGMDLTFSAPKSVSLAALVEGDDRVTQAHCQAVTKALSWFEQHASLARTTVENVTQDEVTNSLLVARFDHQTSRDLDPQLHTHCVVLNVTQRSDEKWRALNTDGLVYGSMAADAVYKAELADGLQRIGYQVERTHADGRFEIVGVSRDQIDHFSKRRGEIVARLKEQGLSSARAAEVAALDTRAAKVDVDRDVLVADWKQQADRVQLSIRVPGQSRNPDRSAIALAHQSRVQQAKKSVAFALEHLSERKSMFPMRDVYRAALEHGAGSTNLAQVDRALDRQVERGGLLQLDKGMVTTLGALQLERRLLEAARLGKGVCEPVAAPKQILEKAGEQKLSHEQTEAMKLVLTCPDRVVGIQGYAGTGKTTLLRGVRELAEKAGYEGKGFSNTASAANVLETETKIPSQTLASKLMARPDSAPEKPAIWITDEASLMGTKQAVALLRRAEKEDAKVILVGDKKQLPAVEAGRPFALLMDHQAMQVAQLKEIKRQRDKNLKDAVLSTIKGDLRQSLQHLQGRIEQVPDRADRLDRVADAFLEQVRGNQKPPLVVTGSNADRVEINERIRAGLLKLGKLGPEKVEARLLVNRSLTKAQAQEHASYRPGDVVRFGRQYKRLGVRRAELCDVIETDSRLGVVTLKDEDGREFKWRPDRFAKVEAYQPADRELRAGDTIRWTRNDHIQGLRNGELAQVASVDPANRQAVVKTASGIFGFDLDRQPYWEHGYASTVHAAQGRTVDSVVIHLDTRQQALTGAESWYVAISRARNEALVVTDDAERLPEAIKKGMGEVSVLEVLGKGQEKGQEKVAVRRGPTLSLGL